MNRREVLAAFLGVPFALAACRRSETPPLPAGEIVGASDVFGHRLRDGLHVEVPPDAWTNVPIVIVGGGVAGLTAAWRLQKSGLTNFVLMELESAPGGTSRSGTNGSLGRALHSRADERECGTRIAARGNGRRRRKRQRRRANHRRAVSLPRSGRTCLS